MKRWILVPLLGLTALMLTGASLADKGRPTTDRAKLTFHVVTADHGCDYHVWATDTLRRKFKVKRNENGSYTVRREDKGRFTTVAGPSPSSGDCENRRGKHGTFVNAGVTGKMHGYIVGTVTGGTFIPNATCTAECTNRDFIAAFFTPGSQFTCNNGYAGCRFSFEYTAQKQKNQHLLYHHWVDRGTDGVTEIFIGDIANR
jgi:hypothetical protein